MIDGAVVLRNLHAFQPDRKPFRDVLLKEAGRADAAVITLHRHGPTADVRQHDRRNRFVVRHKFSLGDAVVGKENFLWMTDHSLTTSRAPTQKGFPSEPGKFPVRGSGRRHKAWGEAQRTPGHNAQKSQEPA